jgi:hypothetical protein
VATGAHTTVYTACRGSHARLARQFFGFVHEHRIALRLGVFAPLALLLTGTLLGAAGAILLPHEANALQFRVLVAATVVLVSFLYRTAPPAAQARSPFPAHNLFLLGIRNTLWAFRLVGGWWLLAAALRLRGFPGS